MDKEKKRYIKPVMQVYGIEPTSILAASPGEDPRGSLYGEIEFSDEYCTNPR